MSKLTLFFVILLMTDLSVLAQTPSKAGPAKAATDTKPLPDCVLIKDGKLQAKPGYTLTLSKDGNTITVSKDNNVGGSFTCACSGGTSGECSAAVRSGSVVCVGLSCNSCTILVVISGVTYRVDPEAGILRKN